MSDKLSIIKNGLCFRRGVSLDLGILAIKLLKYKITDENAKVYDAKINHLTGYRHYGRK